jgi:tetratricopeptide (TPR) repeat protein
VGNKSGESDLLVGLGRTRTEQGLYEQAAGTLEQALAMSRELGDLGMEAHALNALGDVACRTGDTSKARQYHATALRLASETDSSLEQAHAQSGLARASEGDGDSVTARRHWQEALTRYTAIGAPEADEVRARLGKAGDY